MKRKAVLLLALSLLVSTVCGCSAESSDDKKEETKAAEVTAEQITTAVSAEAVTVQPTTSAVTKSEKKEETAKIVTEKQAKPTQKAAAKKKTSKKKTSTKNTNTSISKAKKKSTSVSKPKKVNSKRPKNSYYKYSNYKCKDYNRITIKPKYVRYSGKKIIADCYVVNGFNCTVKNIDVKSFKLYDSKKKVICEADFGKLKNVKIKPYGYAEWRFVFRADCVNNKKASLKKLSWGSASTFDYDYYYYYYYPTRRYYYRTYCW